MSHASLRDPETSLSSTSTAARALKVEEVDVDSVTSATNSSSLANELDSTSLDHHTSDVHNGVRESSREIASGSGGERQEIDAGCDQLASSSHQSVEEDQHDGAAGPTFPQEEFDAAVVRVVPQDCVHVRELLVFNNHVGRIIGKRGQTITDIQQRSGARVDIPQQCEHGTTMRKIRIFGTAEQVEYCSVLVKLQLPNQTEMEIARLQLEVAALQARHSASLALRVVEVPMEHVGRIIGRHGQYLRQLKETTGATVTLPRFSMHGAPHTHQIFTIMGSVDEVAACESVLRSKLQECVSTPQGSPGQHSGGQRSRNSAGPAPGKTPRQVLLVEVPNEHVGRVIGKGGAAIRDLQRQSGAKIHLPGESRSSCREMQIHGTEDQRQKCYQMLIEKVPYLEQATTHVTIQPQASHSRVDWDEDGYKRDAARAYNVVDHGSEHGSPTVSPHMYGQVYDDVTYENFHQSGLPVYPQGIMYQPQVAVQPQMVHVFPDGQYHTMHDQAVAVSPQFEWTSPMPQVFHPEMDMMLMQHPGAAGGGILLSPPVIGVLPQADIPHSPVSPEGADDQLQPRPHEVSWGKPGPIPNNQSEWSYHGAET